MSAPINHNTNGGYMALIAAILISISLLILTAAVSFEGFFSRYSILESNLKEESVYLAEACANTAILELSQDPGFTDVGTIPVGTDRECEIMNIETFSVPPFPNSNGRRIETQGISGEAFTNLRVETNIENSPSVEILTWQEVANF